MKQRIAILFLCALPFLGRSALSPLPATGPVSITQQAHSFGTPEPVLWGVVDTDIACMYPQYTNNFGFWDHGGSSLEGDYTNDLAARTLSFFHSQDTNGTAWNLFMAGDDNGGYTGPVVDQWTTNIQAGPVQVWNGVLGAKTNEPITFPTVHNLPIGGPPEDTSTGGGANQIARNNAATNAADRVGLVSVDLFNRMWTNGVSDDVVGSRVLGFQPGSHYFDAGYFLMGEQILLGLGAEVNVGSIVFNWAAATASTNQCAATGITQAGNSLTATVRFNRMPGAWVTGAGTNGCDVAFTASPTLAASRQWILQVTNLPVGNYAIAIDSSNVVALSSAQLSAGWNMFTCTNGPLWNQRKAVLNAWLDLRGQDHTTFAATHGAGDQGVGGLRDLVNFTSESTFYPAFGTGAAFISAMAPYDADMHTLNVAIHDAAQQTNHTFSITCTDCDAPVRYVAGHL